MTLPKLRALVLALGLAFVSGIAWAAKFEMPRAVAIVSSGDNVQHRFDVEVARTDEHRHRGLMFRLSLAKDAGMLFIFDRVAPVSMWMRNTFIPLTMLFIRADGTIARVIDKTTPMSEESLRSGEPVLAVLELVGGSASKLNLTIGSHVLIEGAGADVFNFKR